MSIHRICLDYSFGISEKIQKEAKRTYRQQQIDDERRTERLIEMEYKIDGYQQYKHRYKYDSSLFVNPYLSVHYFVFRFLLIIK